MTTEQRPVWLRDDGADERLVTPTAYMIAVFRKLEGHHPYAGKANFIENKNPEFVQKLLALDDELDALGVMDAIIAHKTVSPEVIEKHQALATQRLLLTEAMATQLFGSVDSFMKWYEDIP